MVGTVRYCVCDRAVTRGLYGMKPAQARSCTAQQVQILPVPCKIKKGEKQFVKESVAKTPVKKHIKDTGEMVPGVTITERPEKFSVEVV